MTNIEDIAVGDKVRLTRIIEGAVSNKDKQGVRIDNKWHDFSHYTTVEVVEKAKRQWKVGDTLGLADYALDFPAGTVLNHPNSALPSLVQTDDGGWMNLSGHVFQRGDIWDARTIAFIPAGR